MRLDQRQLCDIQGRLFELAWNAGLDCPLFIKGFMNSQTASALDDTYDRLQWAGEEYILEELSDELGGLPRAGVRYDRETMYWAGYTYRYWHYYTGEASKAIYPQADAETMNRCWPGFHTLDVAMAIDNLRESNAQQRQG